MAPLGVSFHLLIEDQGLVLSAILVPFDSNWFICVLGLKHSFSFAKTFFSLCPVPFSLVTPGQG